MTALKKPRKPTKARRPLMFVVRKLVDPATGEELGALVPRYLSDRRAMRDRKYTVGTELRAELKCSRNPGFHRLAHAIANMCRDQIEAFDGLDTHATLKRLQVEANACCEEMALDLGPLGKVMVKQAQSIAFDTMTEDQFQGLVKQVCAHIAKTYWPSMDADAVEQMAELYGDQHP